MKLMLMKLNLILRLIYTSSCRFMACFLVCFSAKNNQSTSNLVSHSSVANSKIQNFVSLTSQGSQNDLSALHLSDEEAASSPICLDRFDLDSIHIDKGLTDEARFLKACGTIPETPIEIRKASQKLSSPRHSGVSEFHSWISSDSSIGFHLGESPSLVKACEEVGRSSFTSEQTASSCIIDVPESARISSASSNDTEVESFVTAIKNGTCRPTLTAGKTKSVRFKSEDHSLRKPKMVGKISFAMNSPNPTPLKLYDEMQTPGTIYPANMESARKGRPRVRSQFVHSVSNLIENAPLYKINKDSQGSLGDRPISGLVAPHRNENEQTEVSPKWCNENGIPNTMTKYKEDQRVSYHATPFEVRLEKVLSAEGEQRSFPQM